MFGYTVLIVDDDEASREILEEYLKLSGFNVLSARDGSVGLQLMETKKPDLVILDIQMPVLDGFRVMEVAGGNPELSDIPVIFLSSLDRSNLKVKGLELGAEDYIVKPFNKAELLARVRAAVRRGRRFMTNEKTTEGSLLDIQLSEILQTMEIGRKTAVINLKDLSAVIYVETGKIVHAVFGDFTGIDALYRVFLIEHGLFSIKFQELPKNIHREVMPIQSTLMSAITFVDEIGAVLESGFPRDSLLKITSPPPEELKRYADLPETPAVRFLSQIPGDLKQNAEKLLNYYQNGVITVVQ